LRTAARLHLQSWWFDHLFLLNYSRLFHLFNHVTLLLIRFGNHHLLHAFKERLLLSLSGIILLGFLASGTSLLQGFDLCSLQLLFLFLLQELLFQLCLYSSFLFLLFLLLSLSFLLHIFISVIVPILIFSLLLSSHLSRLSFFLFFGIGLFFFLVHSKFLGHYAIIYY